MSKRKPAPAKPAAPQEYRKPRADIYTLLLVVALLALILGTAALWMTMKEGYDYKLNGGPGQRWLRPAVTTPVETRQEAA
jgi:hypothetical protein